MTDAAKSPPKSRSKKIITGMIYIFIGLFLFMLLRGIMSNFQRPSSSTIPAQLATCPDSPNCVCSQDESPDHQIDPLNVPSHITDPISLLRQLLQQMPRTKITLDTNNYLRAECTSLIMRYVDDIEFLWIPDKNLIHLRSASRVGYSDMGVNRQRLDKLRLQWLDKISAPQK